ncbi:hypothetical protein BDV28DRAFT_164379 [Aspergillus coremiiformis]|uniref:Uncharacterized protein n=1 Tax=Aspergillus coremiiformis TaxID=138285 RepID=A0A5N6YSL7_9EURO|nr:hypothetical protein BDV28DRAFT_164379 [Aspergillus coremiiformis]
MASFHSLYKFAHFCESSSDKHNVRFIHFERNATAATLEKQIELPKLKIGAFYYQKFLRLTEPVIPHSEAAFAEDMSTGIRRSFHNIKKGEQYSTGSSGLESYTVMYIISQKGMYTLENSTKEDLFQNTVIDMLTHGRRYHPKLDTKLIKDNYIKAYLIHPTKTWKKIAGDTTVGNLVPTLQDKSRWTDIPYIVLAPDNVDDAREITGKNLFKYNPAHKIKDKKTAYHKDRW